MFARLRTLLGVSVATGWVASCSLNIDDSKLQHDAGNGGSGNAQSLGGLGGSGWQTGGTGNDASDSGTGNTSGEASDDSSSGGAAGAGGGDGSIQGEIDCGATSCALASSFCCYQGTLVNGGSGTCQDANSACTYTKILCASQADCWSGQVCCLESGTLLINGEVSCQTSCPSLPVGTVQLCRVDTECPSGQTCQALTGFMAGLFPASFRYCQ